MSVYSFLSNLVQQEGLGKDYCRIIMFYNSEGPKIRGNINFIFDLNPFIIVIVMHSHVQVREDEDQFHIEKQYAGQNKYKFLNQFGQKIVTIGLVIIVLILILQRGSADTRQKPTTPEPVKQYEVNDFIFDYPTLGIPIPGQRYNSTPVKQSELEFYDKEFNQLLKPHNDTNCDYVRIGDETEHDDGGYIICKNAIDGIEGIVNLGINGFDTFGCELSTITKTNNYQFDCTNSKQPQCKTNEKRNYFNYECIASNSKISQGNKYMSLVDILRRYNLTGKHIFLKTDTEGAEWDTFKHFPEQYLQYIDQIALEIHIGNFQQEQWGQLDILRTLMKYFVNINYHLNNHSCTFGKRKNMPSVAMEATLVNKRLIKINSQSRSFKLHHLNVVSKKTDADCQLIE